MPIFNAGLLLNKQSMVRISASVLRKSDSAPLVRNVILRDYTRAIISAQESAVDGSVVFETNGNANSRYFLHALSNSEAEADSVGSWITGEPI